MPTKKELNLIRREERQKLQAKLRPKLLTKKQLDEIRKEERGKTTARHKQSAFMKRTGSIYGSQQKRYAEKTGQAKLPYTLDQLRHLVQAALGTECPYTGLKISLANLAVDHSVPVARGGGWTLDNLRVATKTGNWRKGALTDAEWIRFNRGLRRHFDPAAVEDIYRRLSLGGKWSFRG